MNRSKNETNRSVYSKARKTALVKKGEINCTFCKQHKGENASKPQKTWKKLRDTKFKDGQDKSSIRKIELPDEPDTI